MNNYGLPGPSDILALYPHLTWIQKALLATRFVSIPYRYINQQIPSKALVFELGCGQGILANFLKEAAPQRIVVGMDLSESRIATAQSSVDKRTGVFFLVGDIKQLPFFSSIVDQERPHIYITSQVLYLLPEDQAVAIMRAIGRRLRQQDVYWIVDYCRRPVHKYLFLKLESAGLAFIVNSSRSLSCKIPKLGRVVTEAFGERSRAARVPNFSKWQSLMERAGLRGQAVVPDSRAVLSQFVLRCTKDHG